MNTTLIMSTLLQQQQEIRELRIRIEQLESKLTTENQTMPVIEDSVAGSCSESEMDYTEEPTEHKTPTLATRLLDTFKFDQEGRYYSSFAKLFNKIQRYIFDPTSFTAAVYRNISGNTDLVCMDSYNAAKQVISELAAKYADMRLEDFKSQLAEDKKYALARCRNGTTRLMCIIKRY